MNILYISSESAPVVKVGGLGDVAGSLPPELKKAGADVRAVLPFYKDLADRNPDLSMEKEAEIKVPIRHKSYTVDIYKTHLPDTDVILYLLKNEEFISNTEHEAIYEGDDGIKRFLFFSKAIASFVLYLNKSWQPDVLSLNDWHMGLVPVALEQSNDPNPPKTLLTIHNIGYKGFAEPDMLYDFGFHPERFDLITQRKFFFFKKTYASTLREGLKRADRVSTVSPTYANEILTSEYGEGLQDVLNERGDVEGILNGIDYDYWNPQTDEKIYEKYSGSDGVTANKDKLLQEVKLSGVVGDSSAPCIGFVGRLDSHQKGIDIMHEAVDELAKSEAYTFVILGTGEKKWEKKFAQLAKAHKNVAFIGKFDEPLAHKIYAGSDMILVPSRYEPCGLIQMIAMRYGSLPIARRTGGLADSISHKEDGFLFDEYSAGALRGAIAEAVGVYENKEAWKQMVERAMNKDFSWGASARKYLDLYKRMMGSSQDQS